MMKNKLFYYLIAIACLGYHHKEGNKEQISYLFKQDTVNKSSVAMVPDESSFEMRLYAEVLPVTEDRVYFTIYNHSDREAVFGDDVKIEYYDTITSTWVNTYPENAVYTLMAHPVPSHGYCDGNAFLYKHEPGKYRIVKTIDKANQSYLVIGNFSLSNTHEIAQIYKEPDWSPVQYKDGYEALDMFIKRNTYYPAALKGSGLKAVVVCELTIDTLGRIQKTKILSKKTNLLFEEQAIKLVGKIPGKWQPACDSHGRYPDKYGVFVRFDEGSK